MTPVNGGAPKNAAQDVDVFTIWCRTSRPLAQIARALRLTDVELDAEDSWAWVVGRDEHGQHIDVARMWREGGRRIAAKRTFTCLGLADRGALLPASVDALARRLLPAAIGPVFIGDCSYGAASTFTTTVRRQLRRRRRARSVPRT